MRDYTLSEEQNDLVLKNQRLVNYFVNKLKVSPSSYDDTVSIGTIGLIKAAKTFDKSKGISFATYAIRCINNEIFMYFRKEHAYVHNVISLDDPINVDFDGNELTLRDTIPASDMEFVEDLENLELFTRCINIILNAFDSKKRLIMLYKIAGITQHSISKSLNISQSYISRLEKRAIEKLKVYLTDTQQFKEVFSMTMENGLYRISFSSKDVKNFNKIFANYLQTLSLNANLPSFKVICNDGRAVILLPANLSSFSFVAQMIQEIDNFTMTYVSNENMSISSNNKTESNNITSESAETDESTEDVESDITVEDSDVSLVTGKAETNQAAENIDTIITAENSDESLITGETETDEIFENIEPIINAEDSDESLVTGEEENITSENDVSVSKKGNQTKQVKDYMLSQKSFTVKELKEKFPNITSANIGNIIHSAKQEGLIKSEAWGTYSVIGKPEKLD